MSNGGASAVRSIEVLHVVMRFSGKLYSVGDVVARHLDVIQREGRVWLGKLGARPGLGTVQRLNEQVAGGAETLLFLVESARNSSAVFRCPILRASLELPHDESPVPSYYDDKQLRRLVSCWFETDDMEEVGSSELDRLVVLSSGQPVRWSLHRSMSGFFVVRLA
jgi:hypothetical protein